MLGKLRLLSLWTATLMLVSCLRPHDDGINYLCSDTGKPCVADDDCESGNCVPEDEARLHLVLKPLALSNQNALAFEAYAGDEIPLKVILLRSAGADIKSREDLTPVSGEVISWQISGGGGDRRLSQNASLTNSDGIAGISVNVGNEEGALFQVHASIPGADRVTFSFTVKLDKRQLKLLSPNTVGTVIDRTERLRVQLLRPTSGGMGIPVRGETLRVELRDGARNGAELKPGGSDASIVTDMAGIATVRFRSGSVAAAYEIIFCGGTSCKGVGQQVVNVVVNERGNVGTCEYFTDCEPGYLCVEDPDNGTKSCELAATYCDGSDDCPIGYHCGPNRTCELGPPDQPCQETGDCENGFVCGPKDTCVECLEDGDCEEGYQCSPEGLCIPIDPCADCPEDWDCNPLTGVCTPPVDPGPIIDVSGLWTTHYMFDISDTLPGFFTDFLGPVVDFLDLLFRSQLEIDVPILGDILEAIIDEIINQYVPDWVRLVVTALGDFIHLFEHMLVRGEIELFQAKNPEVGTAVSGEEAWESAKFFIASLCPGGILEFSAGLIPTCGEIDVVLDPVVEVDYSDNDPEVQVAVDPFAGQVQGDWLRLYGRDVDIGLRQLVNVLLDVVVSAASNGQWYDFEDFLRDIVPCADLQDAIDDLACDLSGGNVCHVPGIEAICEAAAAAAAKSLEETLGEIAVHFRLDFDQAALIHHDGHPDHPKATHFGSVQDPPAESEITGQSKFGFFGGDLDDATWWYGVP